MMALSYFETKISAVIVRISTMADMNARLCEYVDGWLMPFHTTYVRYATCDLKRPVGNPLLNPAV